MKKVVVSLSLVMLAMGILLAQGSVGVLPVHADTPDLQPAPAGINLVSQSNPPPSAQTAASGWTWYDGTIQYSTITNCQSIINGNPYSEDGAGTYVGYYADPTDGLPTPNYVYYVHVFMEAVGNSCSGQYGYPEIGLPASTSLAISTSTPVICYADAARDTADCPQTLPVDSTYHPGMYVIPAPTGNHTWPMPQGHTWEFQIPVTSSTTLTNRTFQAEIWVLDGNSSPWLNPTEGVYVFAPPPLPGNFAKSTPANAAANRPTNPTLRWGTSNNATSYEYCIDTTNNNACNATWTSTGTATSQALSGLTPGTTYYWQVRAKNSTGRTYADGSSTAWWSFSIPPLPGAFSKTGPANGATGKPSTPTLKWGASSAATSYEYCLDTINDNTCNTSWVSTGSATSMALGGLAPSTTYYWQVYARNRAGTTDSNGGWWSFTTAAFPGAFSKSGPANGATKVAKPTLSWGASSGATSYEYCLDTVNDNACNTSWVSVGSATSKVLPDLFPLTHYYWQVRARNSAGVTVSDGGWWSFTAR